ncbi:hypothetical protein BB734_24060 [Mycobacterium avium subsp. hominissuis]|uniref:DUF3168 domain-containing protein n=2 Tax=Mycobacterium avium TaxID=1764 RepID=A0A2A3L0R1_MYCAV|nr:hypothetical protein [Mycobacterium avium]PBD10939.1 hypothetical protein BI295_22625 [Mycobacterium avium subsp. hominissuis]PBA24810.1 hypothetical protein CKJ66_21660 [Mycobacterium avium]PBA39712.1 hypothetical protein CKJ63_20075 [Mycobacterium avium]PBA44495.1 hypothetical protein CKJ62_19765 [Mycobacterium avium]PBA52566.1 hypothetical protein CKJ59_01360 [Mycobacterium avium]
MIRVQTVVLPILRAALPGVAVLSAPADVEHRSYPLVVVQRAGGTRNPNAPRLHALPVLEMTATSDVGPVEAEELYGRALDALLAAGHVRELVGPEPADSPQDTWAVSGTIRVSTKNPRS